ncbi:rhodanese-like domain-containing protein [Pseudomonadota bacterium]
MDEQMKNDTLLMMLIGFGVIMFFRFLPRIQAKIMGVPFVNPDEVKARVDSGDVMVIDVRTKAEFTGDLGHIEGALNLDSMKLAEKLRELGEQLEPYKDQTILITCRTHNRSPKAARLLFQSGFKKLMILNNGMSGWNRAGYPVAYKL